jgi:hypothetical protein
MQQQECNKQTIKYVVLLKLKLGNKFCVTLPVLPLLSANPTQPSLINKELLLQILFHALCKISYSASSRKSKEHRNKVWSEHLWVFSYNVSSPSIIFKHQGLLSQYLQDFQITNRAVCQHTSSYTYCFPNYYTLLNVQFRSCMLMTDSNSQVSRVLNTTSTYCYNNISQYSNIHFIPTSTTHYSA